MAIPRRFPSAMGGVLCLCMGAITVSCASSPVFPEDGFDQGSAGASSGGGWVDSAEIPTSAPAAPPRAEVVAPVAPPILASASSASTARNHRVAKGDTLYQLARTYYGDAARWRVIFEANRARIKEPNRLFVGQELVIPE